MTTWFPLRSGTNSPCLTLQTIHGHLLVTYLLVLVGDPLEDANAQVCKLRECSFGQVDMASRAARAEVGDGHVDVSSLVYIKCENRQPILRSGEETMAYTPRACGGNSSLRWRTQSD